MNSTHIHLLITHLPIFGSILGALVLGYALWTKSNDTKMAAYYIFIIAALGGTVAYLTGESAEESVEHITGVSEDRIEAHEDSATFALVSLIVTGVASIAGLVLTTKKSSFTNTIARATLVIALITFAIAARTGYLGGQVRHDTEINGPSNGDTQTGETGNE